MEDKRGNGFGNSETLDCGHEEMSERVRSGGHYCEKCKRCISPPRLRKNFCPEWWTICEECGPNVLEVIFVPREGAIKTNFKIEYNDLPALIKLLGENVKSFKS